MNFQRGDSFLNGILQEEEMIRKFVNKVEEDLHENEPPELEVLIQDSVQGVEVDREKSTSLKEEISILEEFVQNLQKEVDINKQYVVEYKEINENSQERIRILQEVLAEAESKCDSQRIELIDCHRKIDILDKVQFKYEKELKQIQTTVSIENSMEKEIQGLNKIINKLRTDNNELKEKLSLSELRCLNQLDKHEKQSDEIRSLQSTNNILKKKLEDLNDEIHGLYERNRATSMEANALNEFVAINEGRKNSYDSIDNEMKPPEPILHKDSNHQESFCSGHEDAKCKGKNHIRNGSLFNEIIQLRIEHYDELVDEGGGGLSARRKMSFTRRDTYDNQMLSARTSITGNENLVKYDNFTTNGAVKILNFSDNTEVIASLNKNEKRLVPVPELKLNFLKSSEEKIEMIFDKTNEIPKKFSSDITISSSNVGNNEKACKPVVEQKSMRHQHSILSNGANEEQILKPSGTAAPSNPIKSLQSHERKEREIYERNRRNTYETSQCVKLNSKNMDEILEIDTKPFYNDVLKSNIPFHKWYRWIEKKMNGIINERNGKNKSAEGNLSPPGEKLKILKTPSKNGKNLYF